LILVVVFLADDPRPLNGSTVEGMINQLNFMIL